jgi:hypothetical protein
MMSFKLVLHMYSSLFYTGWNNVFIDLVLGLHSSDDAPTVQHGISMAMVRKCVTTCFEYFVFFHDVHAAQCCTRTVMVRESAMASQMSEYHE